MATIPRVSVTLALALCTLSVPTLRAQGPDLKNSTNLGLGYAASFPEMFIGITAMGITPALFGGAGLYADVRFSHEDPGNDPYYLRDVSVYDAEVVYADILFQEQSKWLAIDLAVVYALTRDFAVYAGGGYLKREHYREYFDDLEERGFQGFYWVRDDDVSRTRVNVIAGALFRAGKYLAFQMGAESRPGAMVGIVLTLPL